MKYIREKYIPIANIEQWQNRLEEYIRHNFQYYEQDNGFKSLQMAIDVAKQAYNCTTILTVCYANGNLDDEETAICPNCHRKGCVSIRKYSYNCRVCSYIGGVEELSDGTPAMNASPPAGGRGI